MGRAFSAAHLHVQDDLTVRDKELAVRLAGGRAEVVKAHARGGVDDHWQARGLRLQGARAMVVRVHPVITGDEGLSASFCAAPLLEKPYQWAGRHDAKVMLRDTLQTANMMRIGSREADRRAQVGAPEGSRGVDGADVVLVLGAGPGVDVGKDVVAAEAGRPVRGGRLAGNVVGARVAVVAVEVVRQDVGLPIRLTVLQVARHRDSCQHHCLVHTPLLPSLSVWLAMLLSSANMSASLYRQVCKGKAAWRNGRERHACINRRMLTAADCHHACRAARTVKGKIFRPY